LTYLYVKQVPPSVTVLISGTFCFLFCSASLFYKLLILNNHNAFVLKGWWNVLFTTVFLAHLILSALFLLQLALRLDKAEQTPMFMSAVTGASLFSAASILYKLSLKQNPAALIPEVWITAVFATVLLANADIAFQVLMLGTIFMSLAAGILSCAHSR
jgi:hypothetical protein